jgi:hypothetical protein
MILVAEMKIILVISCRNLVIKPIEFGNITLPFKVLVIFKLNLVMIKLFFKSQYLGMNL